MRRGLVTGVLATWLAMLPAFAEQFTANVFRKTPVNLQDPDAAHLQAGFAMFRKQNSEGALAEFAACKNILMASDDAIIFIGKACIRMSEYVEAISVFSKMIERSIKAPAEFDTQRVGDAYRYRGDAFYDMRKYAQAYADYKKAASIRSTDSAYTSRMAAACCSKLGKFDEALALFDLSASKGEGKPQLNFDKGECFVAMKKYPEAIIEFDRALVKVKVARKTSPERFTAMMRDALTEKARCHDLLGDKAAAAADRQALKEFAQGWEQDLFGAPPTGL